MVIILPESLKILTWILPDFYLSFTVGGALHSPGSLRPCTHPTMTGLTLNQGI
jgi:hypothetical protein